MLNVAVFQAEPWSRTFQNVQGGFSSGAAGTGFCCALRPCFRWVQVHFSGFRPGLKRLVTRYVYEQAFSRFRPHFSPFSTFQRVSQPRGLSPNL